MKKIFGIIVLFFIFNASANAQGLAIGPQVGFIKSKNADQNTIMPGAALRVNLMGLIGEASVYYKSEELEGGKIKATSYPVMLTAMIGVLPIVHLEAGIGWYSTKVEYSGAYTGFPSNTSKDTGYHLGAGVELPLGSILLTGDIRYIFLSMNLNSNTNLSSVSSDYYVVMVGALFKL